MRGRGSIEDHARRRRTLAGLAEDQFLSELLISSWTRETQGIEPKSSQNISEKGSILTARQVMHGRPEQGIRATVNGPSPNCPTQPGLRHLCRREFQKL